LQRAVDRAGFCMGEQPAAGAPGERRLRVLYLHTDGFGGHGGIAQFNRNCLSALCSYADVERVIALPRSVAREVGELPVKLLYDIDAARGRFRYVFRFIRWLVKGPRFDVIVCGHLNLLPLGLLACCCSGAPMLLVLYGIEAWTAPKKLFQRIFARRADWVVAVSRYTLRRFAEWSSTPPERTVILPCCVDFGRFTPGKPTKGVLDKYQIGGRVVVLTLGRLAASERYKGFDELLEVLGRLREAEPALLCVIAGSGDDRPRLEAKARDLGVGDYVRFPGYVPDSELVDLYRASRVFVLAGYGEGFGIVLLEAMACGLPVVASTLDGSFEAVGGGALGLAVDPRDGCALAAGILEGMRRPMGERPSGLEAFSFDAFEKRVHRLLRRLANPEAAFGDTGIS